MQGFESLMDLNGHTYNSNNYTDCMYTNRGLIKYKIMK